MEVLGMSQLPAPVNKQRRPTHSSASARLAKEVALSVNLYTVPPGASTHCDLLAPRYILARRSLICFSI